MNGKRIFFARIIYAIQWFYLAPLLPSIIEKYSLPLSFAGLVPLSFFIGSGSMQLPSAFVASKIGLRRSLVSGLLIMSLSPLLVYFSGSFLQLLLSYMLAGVGASLFFSSGGGLLVLLNKDRPSTALGIYNSLFSLGGLLGLNWILLERYLGFISFALISLMTLFSSVLCYLDKSDLKPNWNVVRDKRIFYLGLSTAGVWGVYYVIGELFPTFSLYYLHISLVSSSEFTGLLLLSSMLGGSLGFLGDKVGKLRLFLISSILGTVPSLLLYTQAFLPAIFIVGIFNELAISVLYSLTTSIAKEGSSIGLAEVNTIDILLGMSLQPIGSFSGYFIWIVNLFIAMALTSFLFKLRLRI
jgi:MFS family permease